MHVLALSASPRPQSNSARLVEDLLEGAREMGAQTERIDLNTLNIRGCQADMACKRTGRCMQQDDMQMLYDRIDEADAVVFASPVYILSVSAQLKTVLDRLFAYLNIDLSSRIQPAKRSALILAQGQADAELFWPNLAHVPRSLGMMGFGETDVLVGAGLGLQGAVAERPELRQRAREMGKRLVQG